jgi:hypothetical protein
MTMRKNVPIISPLQKKNQNQKTLCCRYEIQDAQQNQEGRQEQKEKGAV